MIEPQVGDRLALEFMARKDDWNFGISLYAREVVFGVSQAIAKPFVLEQVEDGVLIAEPFIKLDIASAQQLMDELWRCGIKPTEGTGSAGSLKATERHLEDMRKVAFKYLNISE